MKRGYGSEVWAWCCYDWANSAFALTVMTAFFPVFFKSYWSSGVDATVSTARLGIGTCVAGICVAALSPVLGALADAGGARKKFLAILAFVGIVMTAMLYFVGQGQWMAALIVFVVADVGFSSANLFYDSMLTDVAAPEEMDLVSSLGYSLGYLGCALLFMVNVAMTTKPALFGLASPAHAVRVSFVTASVWWLLFSIPILFLVRIRRSGSKLALTGIVLDGLRRLRKTSARIAADRSLWLFLLAYWLYIDGVFTFMRMAVDFGMSIGLSPASLMIVLIIVQLVAFPAALGFGFLSRVIGTERAILAGIGVYIAVSLGGALLLRTTLQYMVLAALIGMAQGGIQALSRSYFGKLLPSGEAAEYFGFYNLVGKSSVILGPLTVGLVAVATRAAGVPSATASRLGMSSVSLFFIAGGVLLHMASRHRHRLVTPGPDLPVIMGSGATVEIQEQ